MARDDRDLTLAERFKLACELRGVSGRSLEGDGPTKIPVGYASHIATGKRRKLGAPMIQRAAAALGVRFEWLATGVGPMAEHTTPSAMTLREMIDRGSDRAKGELILKFENYDDEEISAAADRVAAANPGRSMRPREWADAIELEITIERRIDAEKSKRSRPA